MSENKKSKVTECSSCDYTTVCEYVPKEHWPGTKIDDDNCWFCDLCNGTLCSNSYWFPHVYENSEVLRTICYVGNTILDALKPVSNDG